MKSITTFFPQLNQAKSIVITTHASPDADALGSSLGLYHYLISCGHQVNVISPTIYPDFLRWMPGNDKVLVYSQEEHVHLQKIIDEAEIIFCLDFSGLDRLRDMRELISKASAIKVLIDHHLDPEDFTDYQLWETKAAATAELIYDFIIELGDHDKITKDIANCIYAGIMTDTGSFKYSSTTAKVHRIVADLIDIGAEVSKISREIYDTNSLNRLRFTGFALLERLIVNQKLSVAYFVIRTEDSERFQLKKGDTEGLVNYALSIKGIVMATIIIEKGDEVKLSFRSVGNYAVNKFANDHFFGGGHKNASGGFSKETLDQTILKFESLIKEFKKNYLITT